jgi:hypothetical protein
MLLGDATQDRRTHPTSYQHRLEHLLRQETQHIPPRLGQVGLSAQIPMCPSRREMLLPVVLDHQLELGIREIEQVGPQPMLQHRHREPRILDRHSDPRLHRRVRQGA